MIFVCVFIGFSNKNDLKQRYFKKIYVLKFFWTTNFGNLCVLGIASKISNVSLPDSNVVKS